MCLQLQASVGQRQDQWLVATHQQDGRILLEQLGAGFITFVKHSITKLWRYQQGFQQAAPTVQAKRPRWGVLGMTQDWGP